MIHYCKKPCYDCPFRQDIPVYMSPEDAEANVSSLLDPANVAVCHHTQKRDRHALLSNTHVLCGGALAMAQALGLKKEINPPIKPTDVVCESLDQLAVRYSTDPVKRTMLWMALQPIPKLIRILKGWRQYYS